MGMIAKPTHGCSIISSRSTGESACAHRGSGTLKVAPLRRIPAPVLARLIGQDASQNRAQACVVDPRSGWRHEAKYHAGKGRVEARYVEAEPDCTPEQEIDRNAFDSDPRGARDGGKAEHAQHQRGQFSAWP